MESASGSRRLGLLLVVAVAVVLRLADFPQRYVMRDIDERPYVESGLALWEGITPTYSRTPGAPQVWITWACAAASTTRYVIFPTPEEHAVRFVLRPFVAGNHALFNFYRDWSMLRLIEVFFGGLVAVAGAAAAFQLGWKLGGAAPAFLIGGMAAIMPLFVELSGQSRPYAMAWGFGFIAIYCAVSAAECPRARRWSAIFMGLAIASRIDMLLLLPLIWTELWSLDPSIIPRIRRTIAYTLVVALVSLLVAPWLLTNLIGTLRAIGSVRVAGAMDNAVSTSSTIFEIIAHQGLAIDLLLLVCAFFLTAPSQSMFRRIGAIYVILLSVSMLRGTAFGLRHQGAPLVALIAFAGVGMAQIARRWPRAAFALLLLALAPPAIGVTIDILHRRNSEVVDHSTAWVERHVPPGMRVYVAPGMRDPLPTTDASNILWNEVASPDAWKKKFESGMKRFGVTSHDYPRAFSEDDMIVERGLRREWFLLGSRPTIPDPRYDVRLFSDSIVFGIHNVSPEYNEHGGVLVCKNGDGAMPTDVGTPIAQWLNSAGQGVKIYCSPNVIDKLKDREHLADW